MFVVKKKKYLRSINFAVIIVNVNAFQIYVRKAGWRKRVVGKTWRD